MSTNEITQYCELNKIAEPNGIVIFGGTAVKELPLCELKQAFSLNANLYNRSIRELSITNAFEIYEKCVAQLKPEILFLQIGEADLDFFIQHTAKFDENYRELLQNIKTRTPKCSIIITSLKNPQNKTAITQLNKHLKYIAESESCDYGDISTKRVWNPRETKDILSFVYDIGFVRPIKQKRPIYDLLKILFCYEPAYTI